VRARIPDLGNRYSVELWLSNGLPANVRPVTGWGPEVYSEKGGERALKRVEGWISLGV
jgi:hypothetical protein